MRFRIMHRKEESKKELYRSIVEEIGRNIRSIRKEKGISQRELGDLLRVSCQQIQKYEIGKDRISSSTLYMVSRVLNVPINTFFRMDG